MNRPDVVFHRIDGETHPRRLLLVPVTGTRTVEEAIALALGDLTNERGYSARQLADRSGHSASFVARILAGDAHPRGEVLADLARVLRADPIFGLAVKERGQS